MNPTVIGETVRRHVKSVPFIIYLVLLAIFALGVSQIRMPARFWPPLISLLSLIVGAGVIGPEFSSGTLQLILVKPINRSIYLLSRVAGVVLVVWIALLVPTLVELIGRRGQQWEIVGGTALNYAVSVVLTCAMLAFFGSISRAYFNVAIYVALNIGLSMAIAGLSLLQAAKTGIFGWIASMMVRFPSIPRSVVWVDRNLFPDEPPQFDGRWLLMVACNAAVALLLACWFFSRREVPYGAD